MIQLLFRYQMRSGKKRGSDTVIHSEKTEVYQAMVRNIMNNIKTKKLYRVNIYFKNLSRYDHFI